MCMTRIQYNIRVLQRPLWYDADISILVHIHLHAVSRKVVLIETSLVNRRMNKLKDGSAIFYW